MQNTSIKFAVAAAAALALGASSASAGTTTAQFQSDPAKSTKKLGSYAGTATYDDVSHLLTVVLQNTSTNAKAGNLTGLAFNAKGAATAAYVDGDNLSTKVDEDLFDDARGRKNRAVKAKPLGTYEAGAAVNGKFGAGGKKGAGIVAGASQTFVFNIDNGAGLTAADLFEGETAFAAAFRGKGKDRVGGVMLPAAVVPPTGSPVVPTGDGGNAGNAGGNTGGNTGGIDTGTGGNTSAPNTPDEGDTGIIIPGTPETQLPEIVEQVPNLPTDGGSNTPVPTAVPLPAAAWSGLGTLGLLAAAGARRKLRELM
jgi:hypothetical protein